MNLFMVFGEPDVVIERVRGDGPGGVVPDPSPSSPLRSTPRSAQDDRREKLVVEIKGVDVYDPTTGQIRQFLRLVERYNLRLEDNA